MNRLLSVIYAIILTAGLTLGQILIREVAPFPFSQINLIFASIATLVIAYGNNRPLVIAAVATLLLDGFSSAPFGLGSLTILSGLACHSLLLSKIFTTHSPSIVALSGFLSNLLYRILWLIIIISLNLSQNNTGILNFDLLQKWSADVFLTTGTLVLMYMLSTRFVKRLKPNYINIQRQTSV